MSERRSATPHAQLSRRAQIERLRGIVRRALSLYGIEPASITLVSHDFNTIFAVTAGDGTRYMLRLQRPGEDPHGPTRRRTHIESELWWLDQLRSDLALPIPEVIHTPAGERLVEVPYLGAPATQSCILFRWIDGHHIRRRLAPVHLRQVGHLTARLHAHSEQLTVPSWFDRPRVDVADVMDVANAGADERAIRLFRDRWSPEAAAIVSASFRRIHRTQEELGTSRNVFGLVHADIHQNNYLFHHDELHLIDFDDCGWGHYLYDFAVTLTQVSRHPQAPALREALLTGYRQVRDLSSEHESMIDAFYMLRVLQDLTWLLGDADASAIPDRQDRIARGVRQLEGFLTG